MDIDNTVGGVAIESTQLLACPFCGSEAEINKTPIILYGKWRRHWTVICKHKQCRVTRGAWKRQEAIIKWNTRYDANSIVVSVNNKT